MNIKKVFSIDKAAQLLKMGNPILFTEANRKNSGLLVFVFLDTEKLNSDWLKLK